MRVLAITQIFPNSQIPAHAPYNRLQFGALKRLGCEVEVLATIPWFPVVDRVRGFSPHGENTARVPRSEVIDGMAVRHPRTLYLPKIGLPVAGPLYAASLLPQVARYRGRIDIVLSAYAYPDGWAGVALAGLLGVPAVVKLHGSDINFVAERASARRLLRWALPRAARVVSVNRQLADKAAALGVARERIDVVYNGVDSEIFHVRDRAQAREALGRSTDERIIVFAGNLKRAKGVLDLLEAFVRVAESDPRARCVLIGRGSDEAACRELAARAGSDRVTFAGMVPHAELARWICASDVVSLPSWNEGTPNVVLEALACGRPVVASAVGGIPDLITSPALGELVEARDIDALVAALARALDGDYEPELIAGEGGRGSWQASGQALYESLAAAL
jgi:glycosyltransferase involved in cell wall biosynthesis